MSLFLKRFQHPKFEGNFLSGYDVGIIHLVRNASLSESVGVIRTAEPGMVTPKLSKARCLITGWGVNSLGKFTGDWKLWFGNLSYFHHFLGYMYVCWMKNSIFLNPPPQTF